jgi:regulatory protein
MSFRRPRGRPGPRPDPDSPEARDPQGARLLALRLLAGRDFAPGELKSRLEARGFGDAAVASVLGELTASGALNESRFASNYVTWHAARGHGPVRIAADLRRLGIPETLIAAALGAGPDWAALARRICQGKFGAHAPEGWPEKARRMRFLQYRGFSADHIRAATGADPDTDQDLE